MPGPPTLSSFAGGSTVSYDLHLLQRARAESFARSASAERRSRLQSRDDSLLAPLLGTTHGDMLSRASERRAAETPPARPR